MTRNDREEVSALATTKSTDDLADALAPLLEAQNLDLVDVELHGTELTVFVDREGGVDLAALSQATRVVSDTLDEIDPIPGRYTLSVSSPGLERRLRTPAHFARAVGEAVTIRVQSGTEKVRRVSGTLEAADAEGCTLTGPDLPEGTLRIAYGEVERARTVFVWGPEPKKSKSERVNRS
ncbi:MAG TPA: ribosome maturation factor RimP [Acidimicrobiales bacterium]|jgi:ribosome maturation factor RimP|nr:ribosome maturation factor RimP [Acidimicrobiales bacterium]